MNTLEKINKWVNSETAEKRWYLRTDPFPVGHLFAKSIMIDYGLSITVHYLSDGIDIYRKFKRTN